MHRTLPIALMMAALTLGGCQNEPNRPGAAEPAPTESAAVPAPPTEAPTTAGTTAPPPVEVETPLPSPVPGESVLGPATGVTPPPRPQAENLTPEFLARQKFELKQVGGATFEEELTPFIEFGENLQVMGKVCNTFRGPGEISDGVLTAPGLVSTKMACPDEDYNRLENLIMEMLRGGAEISMDGPRLFLKRGGTTLTFEAIPVSE